MASHSSHSEEHITSRADVLDALSDDFADLVEALATEIESQIDFYAIWNRSGQGIRIRESLEVILGTFISSAQTGDLTLNADLVNIAADRARQGMPQAGLLHAWRVASHVMWDRLVNTTAREGVLTQAHLDVWSDFLRFVDRYTLAISEAFMTVRSTSQATEMMMARDALDGIIASPDQSPLQVLRSLGLRSDHVVVAVASIDGHEDSEPVEASHEWGMALARLESRIGSTPLWTSRAGVAVLVLPDALHLAAHLEEAAMSVSPRLHIGLSRPGPVTQPISALVSQARAALTLADSSRLMVDAGSLTLTETLAARTSLTWTDVPDRVHRFFVRDAANHGQWLETLSALMDTKLHVGQAAERLHVHTNTVYYRLDSIARECGVDLRDPDFLTEIHLAATMVNVASLPPLADEY